MSCTTPRPARQGCEAWRTLSIASAVLLAVLAPLSIVVPGEPTWLPAMPALIVGAVIALLISLCPRAHRFRLRTPAIAAWLGIYLMASWIGARLISNSPIAAQEFAAVVVLHVVPWLLPGVTDVGNRVLRAIQATFASVASAIAGWYVLLADRWHNTDALIQIPGLHFDGTSVSRNALAIVFALALAVTLPRLATARVRGKLFAWAAVVLLLVSGLVATLSRSGFVAVVALVAAMIAIRGLRTGWLPAVFVAGALIFALALPGVGGPAIHRVANTYATPAPTMTPIRSPRPVEISRDIPSEAAGDVSLDLSILARLDLWEASLRMFATQPLFGVGFQRFDEELPRFWTGRLSGIRVTETDAFLYSHNLYLTILSHTGLVGGVLLILLATSMVRDALRGSANQRETPLLALVVIAIASLFGEPLLLAGVLIPFLLLQQRAAVVNGG